MKYHSRRVCSNQISLGLSTPPPQPPGHHRCIFLGSCSISRIRKSRHTRSYSLSPLHGLPFRSRAMHPYLSNSSPVSLAAFAAPQPARASVAIRRITLLKIRCFPSLKLRLEVIAPSAKRPLLHVPFLKRTSGSSH
jgi:hypothetical protein